MSIQADMHPLFFSWDGAGSAKGMTSPSSAPCLDRTHGLVFSEPSLLFETTWLLGECPTKSVEQYQIPGPLTNLVYAVDAVVFHLVFGLMLCIVSVCLRSVFGLLLFIQTEYAS